MQSLKLTHFFILTVSFFLEISIFSSCDELFTSKKPNLSEITEESLKKFHINYSVKNIEGHKAYIILPQGNHPLNQYAQKLSDFYGHSLAVSPGHTPKIDAALYAGDIETLFTSVQDITRNHIGAATLHEETHLIRALQEELDELHPLFHAKLRSINKKKILKTEALKGYETYISFDEIEAYANELSFSLRHNLVEDAKEASFRLNGIVNELRNNLSELHKNHSSLSISQDDFYHYIRLNNQELILPKFNDNTMIDIKNTLDKLQALESQLKFELSKNNIDQFLELLSKL